MKKIFWLLTVAIIIIVAIISFRLLSTNTQISNNPLNDGQYFIYKDEGGNKFKYSVIKEDDNFSVKQEFLGTSFNKEQLFLVDSKGIDISPPPNVLEKPFSARRYQAGQMNFGSHTELFGPPNLKEGDIYSKNVKVKGAKKWKDWNVYYLGTTDGNYYYDSATGFLVGMDVPSGVGSTEFVLSETNAEGLLHK